VLYHAYVQNWRAVYDGRYRLLAYAGQEEPDAEIVRRRLLFDMEEDPMELDDLSEEPAHVENVRRLDTLLYEQRNVYGDPILPGGFWEKFDKGVPTECCSATR
jgi:hypothetical protein